MDNLIIREDNVEGPEIIALLDRHVAEMHEITPPESVHALDLDSLRAPNVTLWTAWLGNVLAGCGALKQLDPTHGEIKSMHTATRFRGQGVAAAILRHILAEARARGYQRLSLETGSEPAFLAARELYKNQGFQRCGPFSDYGNDPNLYFMTLNLTGQPRRDGFS